MSFSSRVTQLYLGAGQGLRVVRPGAALGNIGTRAIFNITGLNLITVLTAYVTTVLQAVAATLRVQLWNSVIAAAVALDSAAVACNATAAGSILQLPDVSTANPCAWVNAGVTVANYALGVGANNIGFIAADGSIRIVIAGANSTTGAVIWVVNYVPLSNGANIVAA